MNGLPTVNQHPKNDQLREALERLEVDIFLGAETNVNWHAIHYNHRMTERVRGWWEATKVVTAHNIQEPELEPSQYGGTMVLVRNKTVHRVTTSGSDKAGLGRWCWTRLSGRSSIAIRFIAAYRPVLNKSGPMSVFNQHERYRLTKKRPGCPLTMFEQNLCTELAEWLSSGDQVVIGIDLNHEVRNCTLTRELAKLGLRPVQLQRHRLLPETNIRGSKPIDVMFVTQGLLSSKCGYLDYGDLIPSDHRAAWMEATYSSAFGHVPPQDYKPAMRRLQCYDPRVVRKYTTDLDEKIARLNLYERLQNLCERITDPPLPEHVKEWDEIDELHVRAMKDAEAHCRKLRMGAIPWSPQLQQAINRVTYWQLTIKRLLSRKVSPKLLARLRKAGNIHHAVITLSRAKAELKAACQQYNAQKKAADELRNTWLDQLALLARASAFGTHMEVQKQSMRRRELARRDARVCRSVLNRLRPLGVRTVETQDETGNWIECITRHSIETACLRENAARFQQASQTPFLHNPLFQLIDPHGMNSAAQTILQGTFACPGNTTPSTASLIQALRRPQGCPTDEFLLTISVDEYKWRWHRSKEYTATGMSMLHFGHFKAGATHDNIATFECTKTSLPFKYGFSPQRWRKGLDVSLLKKPGNHRVDALRTIILLEPDFNFLNKILGSRMMGVAERRQLIAQEQYGSRKLKSAADHAANKRLTFDLSRQARTALAYCSIDVKACYDRIVWPVASLAMQRVGVPRNPIKMMIQTLQNMQHHVRTIFGTSQEFYDGATIPKLHGIGQGNGAAPAVWAVVSSPIINLQHELGFGAKFQAPLSNDKLDLAGFAYVDDTDLCQSGEPGEDTRHLITRLQKALDTWQGSLNATGGALVPEKCFWVLSGYQWYNGRWRHAKSQHTPGDITLLGPDGTRHKVDRIDPSEGRRTLGIRLSASGNNQAELQHLRRLSEDWAMHIKNGHLPRHLAWRALSTILWPQLLYPLSATTFTSRECRYIMAPAVSAGLAASGIVGTFPRDLVHCSREALGLGVWDLYHAQGWAHLRLCLQHGPDLHSITGKLLRMSIEAMKLEIGLSGPLFCQNYSTLNTIATDSWIKTFWKFLWEHDLRLTEPTPSPQLSRENDQFLISSFLSAGFRKGDLAALNRCRLYLQVLTIADITTGCGNYLTQKAWEGLIELEIPRPLRWPIQSRPSLSDWGIWRQALTTLVQSPVDKKLKTPLKKWLHPPPLLAWMYSPSQDKLFRQLAPNHWVCHCSMPTRARRAQHRRFELRPIQISSDRLPTDLLRGAAITRSSHVEASGFQVCIDTAPVVSIRSFRQFLQLRLGPEGQVFAHLRFQPQVEEVGEAIRRGSCWVATDGSYKDGKGASSWLIVDANGLEYLRGNWLTPGPTHDQSPLRSEIAGIYASLLTIYLAVQYFEVEQGQVTLGSDNTKAIQLCFRTRRLIPTAANFDLLAIIQRLLMLEILKWEVRHIKAHRDPGDNFDSWASLNHQADCHAKEAWNSLQPQSDNFPLPLAQWTLTSPNESFTYLNRSRVLDHLTVTRGYQYWVNRSKISQAAVPLIDKRAVGKALAAIPWAKRIWVIKHTSGFAAVGKQMKRYKQWDHDHCPRCGNPEDTEHVLLCPAPHMRVRWDTTLTQLDLWLKTIQTRPEVRAVIIDHLRGWLSLPRTPVAEIPPDLQRACQDQDHIGWSALFYGFASCRWSKLHQDHLRHHGKHTDGVRWLTAVIRRLWMIAWDFWEDRNGHLHVPDAAVDRRLNEKIHAQFLEGWAHFPVQEHHWFAQTEEILTQKPRQLRRSWLRHVQLLRLRFAAHPDPVTWRSQALMRSWLQQAATPLDS